MKKLVILVFLALLFSPAAILAQNIIVTGGQGTEVGKLPHVIATFVVSGDILPVGSDDFNVFVLFDTGTERVRFSQKTANKLGVIDDGVAMDIRFSGIGLLDPTSLDKPIYAGPAQAELAGIITSLLTNKPNRTLLGGPVTEAVKAVIDYTKIVTRGPYGDDPDGEVFEAPDITFYLAGSPVGFTPAITLNLKAVPPVTPPLTAKGNIWFMWGVSFNEGTASVASPASGDVMPAGKRFLYDTGTTVTEVGDAIAAALGLGTPDFQVEMSSGAKLDGYYLDSITMTGVGGTYTVNDAPVVVVPGLQPEAVIGSNLFGQVKLLFDGPANTLGISLPSANEPPVADAGADQVIEATGPTTSFALDGTGSSDPNGDTLTYSWKDEYGDVVGTDATVTLSRVLGAYMFTLTVTDTGGLTAEDTVFVTIRDTTPPGLIAPPTITVAEGDPIFGTDVYLGQPTVNDICDPAPSVANNAPVKFPLGETKVTWTATDASGNSSTAQQTVTVVPGSPANQLNNLATLINYYSGASGGITPELQPSLLAKVSAAADAAARGNLKAAANNLKLLISQVQAQTGKKINPAVAAEIILRANRIIAALGG